MNGYKIRKMKESDRSEILSMMRVFYDSDALITSPDDGVLERDFNACVGEPHFADGYVFTYGDDIVGYSMLTKGFSTEFGKPAVWIEDIYIKEEHRHRGIGRMFFDFIGNEYKGVVFRLEAEKENKNAIDAYIKSGFTELPYLEMIKESNG